MNACFFENNLIKFIFGHTLSLVRNPLIKIEICEIIAAIIAEKNILNSYKFNVCGFSINYLMLFKVLNVTEKSDWNFFLFLMRRLNFWISEKEIFDH